MFIESRQQYTIISAFHSATLKQNEKNQFNSTAEPVTLIHNNIKHVLQVPSCKHSQCSNSATRDLRERQIARILIINKYNADKTKHNHRELLKSLPGFASLGYFLNEDIL